MEIHINRLVTMSLPVLVRFEKIELRHWGLEGIFLELITEIGSLGRVLTIWENYRHGFKSRHQLADELSDIFFVLIKLCLEKNIQPQDVIDSDKVKSPEKSFNRLCELVNELRKLSVSKHVDKMTIRLKIEEMISIVGGIAEYYQISFKKAHLEEMKLTSLWQKLFFSLEGKKITNFVFLKKLYWKFAVLQHEKKVENISII